MHYLYVKTHNKTGLKYLGKTKSKDPFKYRGSGKYWKRHINKHGYDVTTQILLVTENKEELKQTGLFFSKLWNIVKSREWANLKLENGDGGWDHIILKGRTFSDETKRKMSISAIVRQTGETNSFYGKTHSDETRKLIGEHSKERGKEQYTKRINNGTHPNNKSVCPHCNKIGQYRAMKRWHFDNCKLLNSLVVFHQAT
jgi:hypothetical protein